MNIDDYITAVMSVKQLVSSEDTKYFEAIYYNTFPMMQRFELPELRVYNTYNICTRMLCYNKKPYLIFDNNMHDYIQLSTYSLFSDEALDNYKSLFYAIRADYWRSKHDTQKAEKYQAMMRKYPFILPNYSEEEQNILYNIKYVSFPLQCFHEIVHYYIIGELKKEEIRKLIVGAMQKAEEGFYKTYRFHSLLLCDDHFKEEIYCDCEALYAVILLFSEYRNQISIKDIVDAAMLNLIGIALITEAKDDSGTAYYKRLYLRFMVLAQFIKQLIIEEYIPEDSYEDIEAITRYFFEDIYPLVIDIKNDV